MTEVPRQVITPEDVKRILRETDWNQYRHDVEEVVARDVKAYRIARIKSLEATRYIVFI